MCKFKASMWLHHQLSLKNLSGNQWSVDQDLKNINADNVVLATPAVCIFCSILALLVLLNFNCICLLSRAPEVVELEEGKEN